MVQGVERAARHARAEQMLDLVRLSGVGARRPGQLSGGQRQRVALARALINQPQVLLLDEPLGALDLKLREQMQTELKALQRQLGITFLFITHDQHEALSMSDRIGVFNNGRLEQVGAPQAIYNQPATRFVAEFVGDALPIPAMRAGRFFVDTPLGRLETLRPVGDGPQVVLVRPEEVAVRRGLSPAAARVVGVTYYGHDQVVTVEVAGLQLRSRLGPSRHFDVGDPVSMVVDGPVATFPAGEHDPRPPGREPGVDDAEPAAGPVDGLPDRSGTEG
jgi:putative spermidine/putrescine transport system ATP-binding protein